MDSLEILRMVNGWAVMPTRGPVNDYRFTEEQCHVFNSWGELVAHIKMELRLSGPEPTEDTPASDS